MLPGLATTQCSHCGVRYALDGIPTGSVALQCHACHRPFVAVAAMASALPVQPLKIRLLSGAAYEAPDEATLRLWIDEGRVCRDDLISGLTGVWERLGNLAAYAEQLARAPGGSGGVPPLPRLAPASIIMPASPPPVARRQTRSTDGDLFDDEPSHAAAIRYTTGGAARAQGSGLMGMLVLVTLSLAALAVVAGTPPNVANKLAWARHMALANRASAAVQRGYAKLTGDAPADLQAAKDAFAEAIAIDPRYADGHSGLAEAALVLAESRRDTIAAVDAPHAERSLRPQLMAQAELWGREAVEAEGQAAAAVRRAMALAPQSLAANRAQAELERQRGAKTTRVAAILGRARAVNPDDVGVGAIDAALVARDNPSQAAARLRPLVARAPQSLRLRLRLAAVLQSLGDGPGAIAQLQAVLTSRPQHVEAQARLARLRHPQDSDDVAAPAGPVPESAPAVPAAPPPSAPVAQAALAPQTPSAPAATAAASQDSGATPVLPGRRPPLLAAWPAAAIPRGVLAGAPSGWPQRDVTHAAYAEIISQAQQRRAARDLHGAEALYRLAIARDGQAPAAPLGLAFCAFDEGDFAAAATGFAAVAQGAPWLAEAHVGLGLALAHLGNSRDARKHLRHGLAIAPDGELAAEARHQLEVLAHL